MRASVATPIPAVVVAPGRNPALPAPSGASAGGHWPSEGSIDSNPPDGLARASLEVSRRSLTLRDATEEMLVELRGAPLQTCFSGLGHVWASSAGRQSHYERTRKRDRLDCFVSHDWGTGR
ncbi:unnamed protein product [Prorocentrum cordatum]|uniref:Uncharacterized protein n=1 Tax=Prorocentrum cordatum TaxID=2364126 RepID=A0ABN9T778_9DINO|nr:unnamed protein product [Polarella glacialis]